jgi:hypothetical protein
MTKLRRDDKIRLFMMGDNQFEGRNKQDDVVLDSNADYFIYMQNVNFRSGNIIEGRYLGDLTSNSPILDDQCKTVTANGNGFFVDNNAVKTARMVAVNNKTGVILVIASR